VNVADEGVLVEWRGKGERRGWGLGEMEERGGDTLAMGELSTQISSERHSAAIDASA